MAEKYQVRIRNKSITEWGRWHACFAGTRADGLPRYRPSPVSQICNKTTTECLPSLQTHPIFTRTEKEQQQQSVDSSISFSSRFFFSRTKNQTDEKLVQSINASHRDRSPPFWASSSSENAKSNLPVISVLVAVQFQFGSIFFLFGLSIWRSIRRERKR